MGIPKPDILINRANNTNHHNQTPIVLILLTTITILSTGIYTTGIQAVFANSTNLKQETKQNANCNTIGATGSVSDSCNQAQNNVNVNSGEIKTT